MALTEAMSLLLMPRLSANLDAEAPGVHISAQPFTTDVLDRLAMADLDFALNFEYSEYPDEITIEQFSTGREIEAGA